MQCHMVKPCMTEQGTLTRHAATIALGFFNQAGGMGTPLPGYMVSQ